MCSLHLVRLTLRKAPSLLIHFITSEGRPSSLLRRGQTSPAIQFPPGPLRAQQEHLEGSEGAAQGGCRAGQRTRLLFALCGRGATAPRGSVERGSCELLGTSSSTTKLLPWPQSVTGDSLCHMCHGPRGCCGHVVNDRHQSSASVDRCRGSRCIAPGVKAENGNQLYIIETQHADR